VFLVHPRNDFSSVILNWCNSGCWFSLAVVCGQDALMVNLVCIIKYKSIDV